ncbi:MAG TPA: hypothetical protein VNB64_05245 [Solirubrobacteraceae bacterium]|nr:hypothetical protein [Solirubrobacteraceae bacterium]
MATMSGEAAPAAAPSGSDGQAVVTAVVGAEVGIAIGADGSTAAVGSVRVTITRQERGGVVVTTVVPQ